MDELCGAIRQPLPGMRFPVTHRCGREPNHFGYHCCEICQEDWLEVPASNKEGESNGR